MNTQDIMEITFMRWYIIINKIIIDREAGYLE